MHQTIALLPGSQVNACDVVEAYRTICEWLGMDGDQLAETPERAASALSELVSGRAGDPSEHLVKTFPAEHINEMIALRGIEVASLCEHHLLPFTGTAVVAYIPANGSVVGLSKLARLVDGFARRPQLQERLTQQITAALDDRLQPAGSACVIRARHACSSLRGAQMPVEMVTSSLTGRFRDQPQTRAEFLSLAQEQ